MKRKTKTNTGMGVGVSSVLMIFVALCLTIFATLSYLSAKADMKLTEKFASSVIDYYEADLKAEEILKEITVATNKNEFLQEIDSVIINYFTKDSISYIGYEISIDNVRKLSVELEQKDDKLVKTCWEVNLISDDIVIDDTFNLMQGLPF